MCEKLSYYLKSIRWFEIAVRMGGPVVALLIATPELNSKIFLCIIHALVAFFFCWAHGYSLNEWGGYASDKLDTAKSKTPLISGKITQNEVLALSSGFALISIILYYLLDPRLLFIIFFDIVIGILYVHPKILVKSVPFMSIAILFAVSVNDFLLGWLVFSDSLGRGILIGIYFGMLGISGILYHEAGDYDSDKAVGIKTNAVRFGKRLIFIFGFISYTIATCYFFYLTLLNLVPKSIYLIFVLTYPFFVLIFYYALRSKLTTSAVHRYIRYYRLLYGVIGAFIIFQLIYSHYI